MTDEGTEADLHRARNQSVHIVPEPVLLTTALENLTDVPEGSV